MRRYIFYAEVVHREFEIMKHDLHCNAIKSNRGLDRDRLIMAAEDALKQGLEVWFSPRMFEKSDSRDIRLYSEMCQGS